jgi:hypothetical protein
MKTSIQAAAAAAIILLATPALHAQEAVQWRVQDGGNGHWYQLVVDAPGLTWPAARQRALAMGGDLAVLGRQGSTEFSRSLLSSTMCGGSTGQAGPYVGGFQDLSATDFSEPAGGWRWVDGSPFPGSALISLDDNLGHQDYLHFISLEPSCAGQFVLDDVGLVSSSNRSLLVEWSADCNGDGIVDYGQIRDGVLPDVNSNGIPDCCENGASCDSGPLDVGLQAYLKFDGDCVDASPFGRNGMPTGVQFVSDRFNAVGKAARFDGVTTDVQVQGIPIPSGNAFSWTLWLRIEPMTYGISGVPILQRIESVGNNLMSPSLWLRADGRLSLVSYLIGPGGWDLDTAPQAVIAGNWVHVACTSAASGDRRIYLDGALVAQGTAPYYGQELGLLLVGRDRLDSNPRLRAAVDELRIYDRTLSPSEVVAVRDVGGPAVPTCVDADLFRDFNVNGADLGILLSQWGPSTPLTVSDINGDGVVNGADLGLLLSFWGACP